MTHYRDEDSTVIYVDAIPTNPRTQKQKRMWRLIAMGVAAIVIIVIVIVVAVVVTNQNKSKNSADSSGTNQYPISPYSHMTVIETKNDVFLQQKERFFVIGDVHGCVNELNALVTQLKFDPTKDQLILAGDLTAKGPDSGGVIRRAKELGALCVRGNHDDKVVRLKTYELQNGQRAMLPLSATMPEGGVPDPLKYKNYHAPIALNLTQEEYDYLSSCPVILHLPFLNNTVVVHGGLNPRAPTLQDQVPYLVMNMRDIDKTNQPTPEKNIGTQWSAEWNVYQQSLTLDNMQIFYGHDASRGLNLKQYTFGLDTGCVYGNKLSAMNIRTKELVQVNCPKYVSNSDENEV